MHLRASKNLKSEISLQDPVGVDKEGNEVTLLEILSSLDEGVDETVENAEKKQLLLRALGVLSEKEAYVLRSRYGIGGKEPLTQREVAKSLGISRSYVSRIEKRRSASWSRNLNVTSNCNTVLVAQLLRKSRSRMAPALLCLTHP